MSNPKQTREETGTGESERLTGRAPYEAPRVTFREPLETLAAVCSPAPPAKGNPGICPQGPISS